MVPVLGLLLGLLASPQEPVNATCPVLVDEEIDPEVAPVEYEGVTIGFCCDMCRRKFLKDPGKYAANIPALAARMGLDPAPPPAADSVPAQEHDHDHDHDHDADHEEAEGLVGFVGPFHVLVVHFPIALLLAAALGKLLVLMGFAGAGGGTLFAQRLGTLAALVAAPLGLAAETTAHYAGALAETLEWHETFGLTTAGLALASLLLTEWGLRRGPGWSRALGTLLLFATAICVGIAGNLGGTLVFGPDHLPF